MNAVGLLFQQVGQSTSSIKSSKQIEAPEKAMNFQGLLKDNHRFVEDNMPNESILANEQEDLLSMMFHIFSSFFDVEGLEDAIHDFGKTEEAITNIVSIINNHLSEEEVDSLEAKVNELSQTNNMPVNGLNNGFSFDKLLNVLLNNDSDQAWMNSWFVNMEEPSAHMNSINSQQIHNLFQDISAEAQQILANLTNADDVMKVAPHILKLLEEWTALERKHGNNYTLADDKATTKEQRNWQQLIKAFQSRNQFVTKQQYNRTAQVTSPDVAKWMTTLLDEDSDVGLIRQHPISSSTMPMSRLEQYVIHINQAQGSQPVDQQVVERFQAIMTKSNFLSRSGGINQLSITLKPDNLGEMVVRLTQINGEMTVKIIVTSTATRKMLESNIHQLKNMFSPQQVIIEKQDIDTLKLQEEQEEQPLDKQEQDEQEHENKDKKQDDNGEFETQFQQLLNEKV